MELIPIVHPSGAGAVCDETQIADFLAWGWHRLDAQKPEDKPADPAAPADAVSAPDLHDGAAPANG